MKSVMSEAVGEVHPALSCSRRCLNRAIRNALNRIDCRLAALQAPALAQHYSGEALEPATVWPGLLWLSYEATNNPKYSKAAVPLLEALGERLRKKEEIANLGAVTTLSCVAAYRLSGDTRARQWGLAAADDLCARFQQKVGCIAAGNGPGAAQDRIQLNIEYLMSLPLLYWASEVSGERRYHKIAYRHARQTALHLVREDLTVAHSCWMDIRTGLPVAEAGAAVSSKTVRPWDLACAIYGFTLSYIYTRDWNFLALAAKLADSLLSLLPEQGIWPDFIASEAGDGSCAIAATALAVCGLLELSKHMPVIDEAKRSYEGSALAVLQVLIEQYAASAKNANGLLNYSLAEGKTAREQTAWGDYFYLEALLRVTTDWGLYW
jgi:unsaturated chondroitin disaccharide hydrolase